MAKAGENSDMFATTTSLGDENMESGGITGQIGNIDTKVSPTEKPLTKIENVENDNNHVEDIDRWVASLEKILEDVPSYMCSRGHPGRISRIPENLRAVDVKGYEPKFLSIGPYHHGKPVVQQMEMRKRMALKRVLKYKPEITLKDYLNEILSIETIARSFYTNVEMDSETFVKMLLLDSMCIVTMFCGMEMVQGRIHDLNTRTDGSRLENGDASVEGTQMNEQNGTEVDNEILKMVRAEEMNDGISAGENWYWAMFAHDLFLVENQIPFFVLQRIYSLAFGGSASRFLDIMKYEVTYMLTDYIKQDSNTVILGTEEVHHLLHLAHIFFRPTIQQEYTSSHSPESNQMFRLGSAMQLYEAGVHFEAISRSTEYSLLNITFHSSGKMLIPCLHVDDNTESLLRNLIALEQMKYPSLGLNISAYIVLLLHLISIPKDVELLRRKGIIQHHLASDKEMVYLINRLSMGLAFDYVEDKYSLKNVFQELKHYSERRVPRWRAWLKHRHFSNPWTTISLLVASLILLFTIVQTYYTVYSYYYPFFKRQ